MSNQHLLTDLMLDIIIGVVIGTVVAGWWVPRLRFGHVSGEGRNHETRHT